MGKKERIIQWYTFNKRRFFRLSLGFEFGYRLCVFYVANRDGFAVAVLTCTSSISKRRSNRSNFSFKDANLLFVVDSENTHTQKLHQLTDINNFDTQFSSKKESFINTLRRSKRSLQRPLTLSQPMDLRA